MNDDFRQSLSIEAFEQRTVDFTQFDHQAHVYVGWLYLQESDVTTAISRISTTLQRVAEELGVPDKFHVTVTWFFMLAIAERRQPDQSWEAFHADNAALFSSDENLLQRYYTRDILASEYARKRFVLPDRLAA